MMHPCLRTRIMNMNTYTSQSVIHPTWAFRRNCEFGAIVWRDRNSTVQLINSRGVVWLILWEGAWFPLGLKEGAWFGLTLAAGAWPLCSAASLCLKAEAEPTVRLCSCVCLEHLNGTLVVFSGHVKGQVEWELRINTKKHKKKAYIFTRWWGIREGAF